MDERTERKGADGFFRNLSRRLSLIADHFIAAGRYREARDVMLAAVLVDGENPDCHTGLGVVYTHLDDKRSSRRELETALALDPDFVPGLAIMGEFCLAEGEVEKAIEYFERQIAVCEDRKQDCGVRVVGVLCKAYLGTAQRKKATALVERQIVEHPGDENYLHLRTLLRREKEG